MKICTKCGTYTNEFARRKASSDGLASICKTCTREYRRKYASVKAQPPALKKCTKCNTIKRPNEFYRNRYSRDALHRWCKDCDNLRLEIYRNTHDGKQKIHAMRKTSGRYAACAARAKRSGVEWTLEEEDYNLLVSMPCTYCRTVPGPKFGYGITRLDLLLGFERGNVITCCEVCSKLKLESFSHHDMMLIGEAVNKIKSSKPSAGN